MSKLERFLPGFNKILCGRPPKSALTQLQEKLGLLRQSTLSELADLFGKWVPVEQFHPKGTKENSRQRIYTQNVTFWAFLFQVLSPDSSCRKVVRKIQGYCSSRKLPMPSSAPAAYCKARKRLAIEDLQNIHQTVVGQVQKRMLSNQLWKGHDVKVIDGTGITLPDSKANQKAFPQPGEQRKGCGFPVMTLVACFSLSTGALLHWVESNLKSHESRVFKKMLHFFKRGDIILTDRGYCSYSNIALLVKQGADAVMRVHQKRKVDFRNGKKLGIYDQLITWRKPAMRTGLGKREWNALPDELTLRVVRVFIVVKGFRTRQVDLVTTLLDPLVYSIEDMAELYFRRWSVELYFRHIKTTMKMEMLRGQSPEVIRREILMFVIAYNLIRALMQEAAEDYDRDLSRLSFKATIDTVKQYQAALNMTRDQPRNQQRIIDEMLLIIAEEIVPLRENRVEPRALKRRPKPYQRLTKPRRIFKVSKSRKNKGKYHREPVLS